MKALTISQPFASLIASGEKWVENRAWGTDYRGELAIHAGKGTQYITSEALKNYPTGCVIAVAVLVECIRFDAQVIEQAEGIEQAERLWRVGITWDKFVEHEHTDGDTCPGRGWRASSEKSVHSATRQKGGSGRKCSSR